MAAPPLFNLPAALGRSNLDLSALKATHGRGIPALVRVTQWGAPLASAQHVLFYFGGMPASAEEPALHSAKGGADLYRSRGIHLVCVDKPGMGGSTVSYFHSIRADWPRVVATVADQLGIDRYAVLGMSNGGPHVMACLTHPDAKHRVRAGCLVVGTSDVWASGYFSWKHPSGLLEGLYNTLPVVVTGPLNALLLTLGSTYLFQLGGFKSIFAHANYQNEPFKAALRTLLHDGASNFGLGAAIDCQQGLSPLYANNVHSTTEAYSNIQVPVTLWYGTRDSSVPMASAEWLQSLIPNASLNKVDGGHGIYFDRAEEILDDLVSKLEQADSNK
jgi:pimeloyl-ACP methyl ester carboxylesterase